MEQIRCPFCHEYVDRAEFPDHRQQHLRLRQDGQQAEYVTLPQEDRDQGSLADVPKVYVHRVCGAATGMPEEIIRSYLKDPFLYSADQTFCTGCGYHVPFRECVWTETGEDLQTYMNKLRLRRREILRKEHAAQHARVEKRRRKKARLRPGLFKRILAGLSRLFE